MTVNPFFDEITISWERPEVVNLWKSLWKAISDTRRIDALYAQSGGEQPLTPRQGADLMWKEVIDNLALAKKLHNFCNIIINDHNFSAIHDAVKAIIDAREYPEEETRSDTDINESNENVLGHIFASALNGLPAARQWFEQLRRYYNPYLLAGVRYTAQITERHGSTRLFDEFMPLPIGNIYTRLGLTGGRTGRPPEREDHIRLRSKLDPDQYRSQEDYDYNELPKEQTFDGDEVINRYKRIIIYGKPGSGKTTFLQHIALSSATNKRYGEYVPVIVLLRELIHQKISVTDYLINQFDCCDFPDKAAFVTTLLNDGKFLILVDGLDEVSDERQADTTPEILDLIGRYSTCKYVMTCRVAGPSFVFDTFADFLLLRFNRFQITDFIHRFFAHDQERASSCEESLFASRPLLELGTTPFLLGMLCVLYKRRGKFPTAARAELYEQIVDTVLIDRDSSNYPKRDDKNGVAAGDVWRDYYSEVAFRGFKNGQLLFTARELIELMLPSLHRLTGSGGDARGALVDLEARHGILTERFKDHYTFSHLTLQEYFTSRYMIRGDKKIISPTIHKCISNASWQEVFTLLIELGNSTEKIEILEGMRRATRSTLVCRGLVKIFDELTRAVTTHSDYSVSALRASVLLAVTIIHLPKTHLHASFFVTLRNLIFFILEVDSRLARQLGVEPHTAEMIMAGEVSKTVTVTVDQGLDIVDETTTAYTDNNAKRKNETWAIGFLRELLKLVDHHVVESLTNKAHFFASVDEVGCLGRYTRACHVLAKCEKVVAAGTGKRNQLGREEVFGTTQRGFGRLLTLIRGG